MICPGCGKENDDGWPLEINGKIQDGGCQDCWEAVCDKRWRALIGVIGELSGGQG